MIWSSAHLVRRPDTKCDMMSTPNTQHSQNWSQVRRVELLEQSVQLQEFGIILLLISHHRISWALAVYINKEEILCKFVLSRLIIFCLPAPT